MHARCFADSMLTRCVNLGKGNLLLAVHDLEAELNLKFSLRFTRNHFFLQGADWEPWLTHTIGVPSDATRYDVAQKIWGGTDMMNKLFLSAGRDARNGWGSQYSDSMDSHRLAYWAATISHEAGEKVWNAIGERYFEGRHAVEGSSTAVTLADHGMLLQCAADAGLDLERAEQVLSTDEYRKEVQDMVAQVKASGVQSIPVITFQVEREGQSPMTLTHHGSGNKADFRSILEKLHAATAQDACRS